MADLELLPEWLIPDADLLIRAVRSSGPGGQNVNKVSTKVELRFQIDSNQTLNIAQKRRLCEAHPSMYAKSGEFIITCDESRSQDLNREKALERLRSMILAVRIPPKFRVATRPTKGSQRRRIEGKKRNSQLKETRKKVGHD